MANILIAEDDQELLDVLALTLRDAGHTITAARDGQEAVGLLKDNEFEILITDIVMPNKEGIETIMDVRRQWPEIKIVAMSGGGFQTAQQYLDIAHKLGAAAILPKPFHRDQILAALDQILGSKPSSA